MTTGCSKLGPVPGCRDFSQFRRQCAAHNGIIGPGIDESSDSLIINEYSNVGGNSFGDVGWQRVGSGRGRFF